MATQQCYINNPNPLFSKAHLTNFNLNHFKMVEAMVLKILHWGPLEWQHLPTKFHENLPFVSKVISGGHTDRHTSDLISILSFLESGLKRSSGCIKIVWHNFKVLPPLLYKEQHWELLSLSVLSPFV
jgi:hypothetical protein